MALEVAYFQATIVRKKPMESCVGGDTFVAELGSQQRSQNPSCRGPDVWCLFYRGEGRSNQKENTNFPLSKQYYPVLPHKMTAKGTHRAIWEVK